MRAFFLVIFSTILISCATAPKSYTDLTLRKTIIAEAVKKTFDQNSSKYYLQETGFDRILKDTGAKYQMLPIPGKFGLVCQIFSPKNQAAGTVFFTHGYLDQVGYWGGYIKKLIEAGFVVVCFDLPGHGLSAGTRADIADFNQYGEAIDKVVRFIKSRFSQISPRPWIGFGHSTGCTAWLIYCEHRVQANEENPLDGMVFLHPLVRPVAWPLIMSIYKTSGKTIRYYPFPRLNNSQFTMPQSPIFLIKGIPVSWLEQLMIWHNEFETYKPIALPCIIVQGLKDQVVDVKYNIPRLQAVLTNSKLLLIEGAQHIPFTKHKKNTEVQKAVLNAVKTLANSQ